MRRTSLPDHFRIKTGIYLNDMAGQSQCRCEMYKESKKYISFFHKPSPLGWAMMYHPVGVRNF
jgi:hypothetical protein